MSCFFVILGMIILKMVVFPLELDQLLIPTSVDENHPASPLDGPTIPFSHKKMNELNDSLKKSIIERNLSFNKWFIKNVGQLKGQPNILYYYQDDHVFVGFARTFISHYLTLPGTSTVLSFNVTFSSSQETMTVTASNPLSSKFHYYIGEINATDVQVYQEIIYREIYPHVDLRYFVSDEGLKYELLLRPGADPTQIAIRVENLSENFRLKVEQAEIILESSDEKFNPVLLDSGLKAFNTESHETVVGDFVRKADNAYGFMFQNISVPIRVPITIDPYVFSTFLGGSGNEGISDLAMDSEENIYIIGSTTSTDFPATNVYNGGTNDLFICKVNSSGQELIFCTFLGGSGRDYDSPGAYIGLDSNANIIFASMTDSSNFPMVNSYDSTYNGGGFDLVVGKLKSDGSSLLFSTYYGGTGTDGLGQMLFRDSSIYLSGTTSSSDFPIVSAWDSTYNGNGDGFAVKLDSNGYPVFSTFIGGSRAERGGRVALNSNFSNYMYLIFETWSDNDFPTTSNAFRRTNAGVTDFVIAILDTNESSLVYATYIGGSGDEGHCRITVDSQGDIYFAGVTSSSNFPMNNSYDASHDGGGRDLVIGKLKVHSDHTSLVYSTFFGGSGDDESLMKLLLIEDTLVFLGRTTSSDFPTKNAEDSSYDGGYDGFVSMMAKNGSTLLYSTYIGGSSNENARGALPVRTTRGTLILGGWTESADFPTVNALNATHNGGTDAFLAKLDTSMTLWQSQGDTDADGMPDWWEDLMGLNSTDPNDASQDKDGDGMPNLWEYQMGLNATDASDASQDKDGDGLSNLQEYQLGTNATAMDTDGDLMPDGWEYQMGLNATDASDASQDKDGDGMPNLWEYQMGLNATDASDASQDKDGDGLSNLQEYQLGTNATALDTDGDLMPDGWEYQMGLNASDSNDASQDKDGDGMPNLWEYQMGLNATDAADATQDKDGDGLTNVEEYQVGTSATNPDSDGDGLLDGVEVELGLSPLNPDSDGDGTPDGEEVGQFLLDPKNPSLNQFTRLVVLLISSVSVIVIFLAVGFYWKRQQRLRREREAFEAAHLNVEGTWIRKSELQALVRGTRLGPLSPLLLVACLQQPRDAKIRESPLEVLKQLDSHETHLKKFLELRRSLGRPPSAMELFKKGVPAKDLPLLLELANVQLTDITKWLLTFSGEVVTRLEELVVKLYQVDGAIRRLNLEELVLDVGLSYFEAMLVREHVSSMLSESEDLVRQLITKAGLDASHAVKPLEEGDSLAMRVFMAALLHQRNTGDSPTFLDLIEALKIGPLLARHGWQAVQHFLSLDLPDPTTLEGTVAKLVDGHVRSLVQCLEGSPSRSLTLEELVWYLKDEGLTSLYVARLSLRMYNEVLLKLTTREETRLSVQHSQLDLTSSRLELFVQSDPTSVGPVVGDDILGYVRLLIQGGRIPLDRLLEVFEVTDRLKAGHQLRQVLLDLGKTHSLKELTENRWWLTIEPRENVVMWSQASVRCQVCSDSASRPLTGETMFSACVKCGRQVCGSHYLDLVVVGRVSCPYCDGDLRLYPVTCQGCGFDVTSAVQENDVGTSCRFCGYSLPSKEDRHRRVEASVSGPSSLKTGQDLLVKGEKAKID